MSMFGLLLAGGSIVAFAAVYIAGALADKPSETAVLTGLGLSTIGLIAGVTLAIAGLFV
jgi:dipeptide/tripeptide permease